VKLESAVKLDVGQTGSGVDDGANGVGEDEYVLDDEEEEMQEDGGGLAEERGTLRDAYDGLLRGGSQRGGSQRGGSRVRGEQLVRATGAVRDTRRDTRSPAALAEAVFVGEGPPFALPKPTGASPKPRVASPRSMAGAFKLTASAFKLTPAAPKLAMSSPRSMPSMAASPRAAVLGGPSNAEHALMPSSAASDQGSMVAGNGALDGQSHEGSEAGRPTGREERRREQKRAGAAQSRERHKAFVQSLEAQIAALEAKVEAQAAELAAKDAEMVMRDERVRAGWRAERVRIKEEIVSMLSQRDLAQRSEIVRLREEMAARASAWLRKKLAEVRGSNCEDFSHLDDDVEEELRRSGSEVLEASHAKYNELDVFDTVCSNDAICESLGADVQMP